MVWNSSTYYAVTGSQKPYIFDLPKVISLPQGSEFRFRYRPKWVQKEMRDTIDSNRSEIIGSTLAILFHSQERKRLIPLRKAKIIDAKRIGPMIYLRFRLGKFNAIDIDDSVVPHDSSGEVERSLINQNDLGLKITGPIEGNSSFDLEKPLPPEWYVRRADSNLNFINWNSKDESAAWASIATILHSEPNLSGVPFFFIEGFEDESGKNIKTSEIMNSFSSTKSSINGFKLVEGNRYRLNVVEWCEPSKPTSPLPNVEINCEPFGVSLAFEGASNMVVGRYDVLEFSVLAQKPGFGEISISATPTNLEKSQNDTSNETALEEWLSWPSIFVARIKVKVSHSFKRILRVGFIGLLGISLYLFGPDYVTGAVKEGVQLMGLFLALTAFGAFTESMVKMREHITKISQPAKANQP